MPSVPNPRVTFKQRPTGKYPTSDDLVYDSSPTIDLDNAPLNGGYLTKTLILNPEAYMHERMRDPSIQSYSTPMILGAPVVGMAVVIVLRSEKEGIKAGDYMVGMTQWELYTVQPYMEARVKFDAKNYPPGTEDLDSFMLQVVPDPNAPGGLPLVKYHNLFGIGGQTAFLSFHALANAKAGETIFVSAGASTVGSLVIQIAKLSGMRVISSVGSDAKVEYLKSLGCDHAFNYKKEGYRKPLAKHGPIDVFYDNVGGECLEAGIENAAFKARVIICGAISDYGLPEEQRHGIKNAALIFKRRITVTGFIVMDFFHNQALMSKFFSEVPKLFAEGKLKTKEIVYEGLDKARQALVDVLKGSDEVGKHIVVVATQ